MQHRARYQSNELTRRNPSSCELDRQGGHSWPRRGQIMRLENLCYERSRNAFIRWEHPRLIHELLQAYGSAAYPWAVAACEDLERLVKQRFCNQIIFNEWMRESAYDKVNFPLTQLIKLP